jgi:hypothetical protein
MVEVPHAKASFAAVVADNSSMSRCMGTSSILPMRSNEGLAA